jgi:hypothetical protein
MSGISGLRVYPRSASRWVNALGLKPTLRLAISNSGGILAVSGRDAKEIVACLRRRYARRMAPDSMTFVPFAEGTAASKAAATSAASMGL